MSDTIDERDAEGKRMSNARFEIIAGEETGRLFLFTADQFASGDLTSDTVLHRVGL